MAKPNIDIVEINLSAKCGEPKTLTVKYTVYESGPCRICLDIPAAAPVYFSDTSSNSKCVSISNPKVGESSAIKVSVSFDSLKRDIHLFMMTGTITDSEGNSRSDYLSIQVDCR